MESVTADLDNYRVPPLPRLLGGLCRALARWGDVSGCLGWVCRSIVEGVPGVESCAAYGRHGARGLARISRHTAPRAAHPPDVEMLRFAERVLEAGGPVCGVLECGLRAWGMRVTGRKSCELALVAATSSPGGAREREVLDALAFAANLSAEALRSLEPFETEVQERAMRRLQAMRNEVMALLSHEMRTPLAGIKGYVTALLRDDVAWSEETRREFLQVISEESDKLERMIASILDMSAMETGGLGMEKSPTLLPRLASEVVAKIGSRSRKHTYVLDFEPGFPVVMADPMRIEQVLFNLLDNAVKYSPDGGLIVVTGRVQRDYVVTGVADQGKGIPAEHLNRLFEKYFRAGSHRRVGGVGLGLPIARQIVEAHGGRIWAESTEGKGTTVYFTLPIEASQEDDA